jgi:predicted membrane protein
MATNSNSNGRIWLGAILIIAGMLLFMRNFHFNILYIDIFSWPFIVLIIGILIIANSRESFFGVLLVVVGSIGIASRYLHISFGSVLREYWPILLIILGIYTLMIAFTDRNSGKNEIFEGKDYFIDIFSFIGDRTRIIKSESLLGGKVTTLLSELQLDLRESKLAKIKTEIDSVTIFGSTKIIIPQNWEVVIKTTTIFGGFEDKRGKINGEGDNKVLVVRGLVLFGGGEITC